MNRYVTLSFWSLLVATLTILIPTQFLFAAPPFYCEKSSYQEGQTLFVIGVALNASEATARDQAFQNGLREAHNFFQKKVSLPNVKTQRTFVEKTLSGAYYACRIMKIDLTKVGDAEFRFQHSNVIGNAKARKFFKVKVLTNPAGAHLVIGDQSVGKTDALLERVSQGSHKLILVKDGYSPVEATVDVDKDLTLTFSLEKKKIPVKIHVNADDVRLFVNGRPSQTLNRGENVMHLEIDESYKLRAEAENHLSAEQNLIVNASDQTRKVNLKLEPYPSRVTLVSDPPNARVIMNGTERGTTPKTLKIKPGTYQVVLQKEGYLDQTDSFELKPNESITRPIYKLTSMTDEEVRIKNFPWRIGLGLSFGGAPFYYAGIKSSEGAGLTLHFEKWIWGLLGLQVIAESASTSFEKTGAQLIDLGMNGLLAGFKLSLYKGLYVSYLRGQGTATVSQGYGSDPEVLLKTKVRQTDKGVGYAFSPSWDLLLSERVTEPESSLKGRSAVIFSLRWFHNF